MSETQTKTPEIYSASYSGIYLERSGVGAKIIAEQLTKPPTHQLESEEIIEVRQFEAEMLSSVVTSEVTLEDALRTQIAESKVAPMFFAKGILAGEVSVEGIEMPDFATEEDIYAWVASSGLDSKTLMRLSKKSIEYYKQNVAKALVENGPVDNGLVESRPIILDCDEFAKNMNNLQAARTMLLDAKKQLTIGTNIDDAKRAYIDIFMAKVNSLIASGIPTAHTLQEQADLTNNPRLETVAEQLLSPTFYQAILDDTTRERLNRRLDFLRNGIGYDSTGRSTSVSAQIEAGTSQEPSGGVFTPEQMSQMKQIMLSPEEIKQVFRSVMDKAGLLSSEDESTYYATRSHRAVDDLYQVVISPDASTFAVSSISGVFKTPSEPRSLYDVIIVGGFHELEHINQAIADDALSKVVRVAKIKGKRVSGLREAGANMVQRSAEKRLFGYEKPYAETYANALRALEGGGSITDATKAFYETRLRVTPEMSRQEAAAEAADRVLRLVRGGINSQPMVYAEESIIQKELVDATPVERNRALVVTSLDLVDQARLHKFGLLEVPSSNGISWGDLVLAAVEPWLKEAKEAHAVGN